MSEKKQHKEDLPVTLTSVKAMLIERQIVLYVTKETFEEIIRERKGELVKPNDHRQFYMDDASICFIESQ